MSKWGVFDRDVDEPHVAPCTDDGVLLPPHELTTECSCKPVWDNEWIWVHNDPRRGGCNS